MKVSRSARKTLRTGVRWKKGQSSSSNPRCQRFREAASAVNRARVVQFAPDLPTQGGGITKAALERHNKLIDGKDQIQEEPIDNDDDESSVESVETWATNFTGCTNQCFEKVLTHWADRQNSEARRSALAVLAAVAQLIRDRGGRETNEEYFQALLTALVSVDSDIRPAAAHLLSVLTKRMDPATLAPAFAPLTQACLQLLHSPETAASDTADQSAASSGAGLPRSLLLCLGSALAALPKTAWHAAATRQVLQAVLQFTQSDRPRIRKAAMQAVTETLASTEASVPVALVTAFALDRLNSASSAAFSLRLLRVAASHQTERQAKSTVEAVLALAPTADARTFAEAMLAIRSLFWRRRLDSRLPVQLIGQIVSALYDARPPWEDAESTRIWLDTAKAGLGALAPVEADEDAEEKQQPDSEQCQIFESHLIKLFTVSFRGLGQSGLAEAARRACRDACHHVLIELAPRIRRPAALASIRSAVLATLTSGLSSYQYYPSWPHIGRLLSAFIRCHGDDCRGQSDLTASLTSLANLRDTADDKDADLCTCLESALAAALETLGPTDFLAAVSLDSLDPAAPSDTWRRSWLLPMLPRHIRQGAQLAAFSRHLLPLAKRCQQAAASGSPTARLLELQVWQSLPAFCYGPTDAAEALPGLARQLGELLMSRSDIRLHLLAALRRLSAAAADNSALYSLMSGYAKNYVPRLFALHSDSSATRSHRLAALETIRVYAKISPSNLLSSWFAKAAAKVKEAGYKMKDTSSDEAACRDAADLVIALAPSLTDIGPAVDLCNQWCSVHQSDSDVEQVSAALEKKGYRLAEALLTAARKSRDESLPSNSGISSESNIANIRRLAKLLLDLASSGGQASPSSRKSRLRCLALCVSNGTSWLETDEQRRQLAELALPEAVLGSTEQNSQAREAADSLLLEVFRFYAQQVRTDVDEDDDAGGNAAIGFLAAVFAAAGNEPATLQAALYSVTGLLSHLRHCMNRSLLASLLQRLSDTMSASDSPRTLVKAALRCLASVVRKFGHAYTLEQVAQCLEALPVSLRPAFRATVRRILTDLLAGFPYETLRAGLPAFYHKQLTNVRKRTEHKERLKQRGKRGEDSQTAAGREDSSSIGGRSEATRVVRGIDDLLNMSSDSSASEDGDGRRSKSAKSGNKSRSKRSADSAWLEEADDEILDLRDSLAAARIHRSRPPLSADAADAASKRRRLGDDFKLSSDGRLIIEESDSDDADISEKAKQSRKMKQQVGTAAVNDDEDIISGGVSSSSDDEDDSASKPKYRPGGRGIHRDMTKQPAGGKPNKSQQLRKQAKSSSGATKIKKKKTQSDGLDPYSYLSLDRRLLNRKNVAGKLARLGKYKNLVRAPASSSKSGGSGGIRKAKARRRK
ncbi:hypothetical protein BOX15_Mlig000947g3 [Macrostomum lignano]|uniref:Uncharacterized protein n=1 Tax=Macrostomum lignano TaxID=282301 RepID=A0A267DPV3_9PLAT|nr:hypothetical protein BOX15_Mlig000947g3 [Macrostomum lignano]